MTNKLKEPSEKNSAQKSSFLFGSCMNYAPCASSNQKKRLPQRVLMKGILKFRLLNFSSE